MDLSSERGTKNPHIEDFKKKFDITDLKRGKDGLQIITDLPSLADSIKNGVSHTTGKGNSDTQALGTVGNNAIDALTFWDDMKRIQEQIDNISDEKLNNLIDTGGKIIENDGKITVNGGMPTIDSTRKYNEIANNGFKNYMQEASKEDDAATAIEKMFQKPLTPEQDFILNGKGNINDINFTTVMDILNQVDKVSGCSVFDWIKKIK